MSKQDEESLKAFVGGMSLLVFFGAAIGSIFGAIWTAARYYHDQHDLIAGGCVDVLLAVACAVISARVACWALG
jgi:hypothetical protein